MTKPTPQADSRPRGARLLPLLLAAALTLLPLSSQCLAAEKADKSRAQATSQAKDKDAKKDANKAGPRAQPWAFGGGKSASTWANQGVDGSSLQRNATAMQPKSDKDSQKTASKERKKSLLGGEGFEVSVDEERQGWTASPSRSMHADEDMSSDIQHRVRAFATHQDDNLSIGLGPEFVVKDTNEANPVFKKNHDQPEVDAGVGMQFKLDF